MPAHVEGLADQFTAPGTRLRGVSRVDLDHFPASFLGFVGKDLHELCPTTIGDGFGEMAIFDHTRHIEVFHGYPVVPFDKSLRGFVRVVAASASDFLMRLAKQSLRFLAPLRAFLPAGNPPLRFGETTFGFFVAARILNSLSSGQGSEALYTHVHPDGLSGLWKRLRLDFADHGDVPAIGFANDSRGLRLSFERAVPEDLDVSGLRESEPTVFELRAVAILRVAERVVPATPFESRIAGCFFGFHPAKEVLKATVHTTKHVLQDLRMRGLEVMV